MVLVFFMGCHMQNAEVREIPDAYFEMFRTAMGLPLTAVESVLPDVLRQAFWRMKFCFDRVRYPIEPPHIAILIALAEQLGVVGAVGPKPTFLTECNAGRVKYDDPVEALFKNQWTMGLYRSHTAGGEIVVEIDGNDQRFAGEAVRWPGAARATQRTNELRRRTA